MQHQQGSEIERLAKERWRFAETARNTHYTLADWYRPINYVFGSLAVVASAIVSAGLFTAINSDPSSRTWKLAGAIVAAVAAGLTSLTSFLGLGPLAEKHRQSGADFGEVAREYDLLIESHPADDNASRDKIRQLDRQIGDLESNALGYPGWLFRRKYKVVGPWKLPE